MSNSPQKVYIVTDGEYSDYHIERVFLSEEKSKKYATLKFGTMWLDHIETYENSDDSISISDFNAGRRPSGVAVFGNGDMLYWEGEFRVETNSAERPEIYTLKDGVIDRPVYKVRARGWSLLDRAGIPDYVFQSPYLYSVQRTGFLIRKELEPDQAVRRQQMIDIANQVKFAISEGATLEQTEEMLNNQ